MADLKTRKAVKGTVKTIDRAAVAAERLKSAAVRTKNAAERSATPMETSSQEYGAQQLERTAQDTVSELGKNAGMYCGKTSQRRRCRLPIHPSP